MEAVPTVKALDLLRLLAVTGRTWQSGDHYIAQLWPESDHGHARASLRTAVAHLRRAFGPEIVRRSGDLLGVGDIPIDVVEMRDLIERVEAARLDGDDMAVVAMVQLAQSSYGGDLLVSGSSCDAVYAARDELRALRRRMLLDGAAAASRQGWMRDSLELASAAHSIEVSEESARALMVAWAGIGETKHVIDTFERLTAELEDVYGIEPSPPTRLLYFQLVAAGEPVEVEPDPCQQEVVVELATHIRSMQRGPERGGVVWLQGEPGSGRGTVAREARKIIEEVATPECPPVEIAPEVVEVDGREVHILHEDALASERVLVVPIRKSSWPLPQRDPVVRVDRLDRKEFHDLLVRLLQDPPTRRLETRLWRITGGLAGRTRRTVARLARDQALVWTPDGMDLARKAPVPLAHRVRRPRMHQSTEKHGLLAPMLLDFLAWTANSPVSAFGVLVA